jgi:DNA-binding CsgD family transcriptional regulator
VDPRDRIVSLMYEAAVSPELWPAALEAFAASIQAVGAILMAYDNRAMEMSGFMGGSVLAPDSMPPYIQHYYRLDPLFPNARAARENDSVMLCQEHVSEESVAKSEFYQDFLIPKRGRHRAGWHLESNPDRLIYLGLFRDAPRFERSELRECEHVAQHARQAARLMAKVSPQLARGELLRQAMDHSRTICIMVDSNARVLDCSAAAVALLEGGKVLTLSGQSQLAALSTKETARLRGLIVSATTGGAGGLIRLAGHWLAQVIPSGVAQQNPFDPRFSHCALVFVTPPKPLISLDWRKIQVALDCTRAEAEVAADLGSGMAPNDIAAKRNVSPNTVRTQIRMLLERTEFHRIAELVSFLGATR